MNDPALNSLLKWGIENSQASQAAGAPSQPPASTLNPEAIRALLGGKSDAQLMVESMDFIDDDKNNLDDRVTAFDNFEQLIEGIDNANNMENLGLWSRLVSHLESAEADLRMYAAWCTGIAVQNNIRSQERVLILGAIPTLVTLATTDKDKAVRKKAILALSSIVRNFQPGLDETVEKMPSEFKPAEKLDASDMKSVDSLINKLRESI